jgi:UDP-GlcNAc3NAcA epimerase
MGHCEAELPSWHRWRPAWRHDRQATGEESRKYSLPRNPTACSYTATPTRTLAGALAAAKLHIPVAHVEAGCGHSIGRMPEEINRVPHRSCCSVVIRSHLPLPEQTCGQKAIERSIIRVVGRRHVRRCAVLQAECGQACWFDSLDTPEGGFVLCTIHRAENTDDAQRLQNIFEGLADCGRPLSCPCTPRTRAKVEALGLVAASNIVITEPSVIRAGLAWR